jgi:hypothetical protein
MLEERSRSKNCIEASLSMGRGKFRNRSLSIMFALGEASLAVVAHGQDFNRARLYPSLRRDGFSINPCLAGEHESESLSAWSKLQHFATLSIGHIYGQFDRAIPAAVSCSKGDAECNSRLH